VSERNGTGTSRWPVVLLTTVIIAAILFCVGCKKDPSEQTNANTQNQQENPTTNIENPTEGRSLDDVIRYRRTWDTAFTSWYGKTAPDFILTDIAGKQHKLSDYRGKDVMLIFWATWCGPCIMEIPSLIELRKTTAEDKLAMLAISYRNKANTTEMVRSVVERQKINYTVFSVDISDVSEPYNRISGIPSSFFIDPKGKIKLATLGVLSLDTIKAILQAK
jgi:thiol-disulfide isomerase/thioredoxin